MFSLFVVLTAVLFACSDRTQQQGVSDDASGKKLAFGTRLGGDSFEMDFDYNLYVMNANGSDLTRLAGGVDPAWSPNGKMIAFVRYVDEPNPSSVESAGSAAPSPFVETPYVFVMNADGSDQKQLLDSAAVEPVWLPDGKEIAFSKYYNSSEYCGTYIVNADGSGEPRKLATGPGCTSPPSWSPDGSKIAFIKGGDIYVANAPSEEGFTNSPRRLTDDAGNEYDPAWSPDGTQIAFTNADQSSMSNIYKMDADGSGETALTKTRDSEGVPAWSPDGKRIAFVNYGYNEPQIYVMNSDGSNPTLVRKFEKYTALWGLAWQPRP